MATHVTYDQDYFSNRNYSAKQQLVKRHVLEVLKWASKATHTDLMNGQGKRALDVGCAYGYASEVLAELGYETLGTDISVWGTRQARKLVSGQFLICDAQTSLPFKAESFDLVTCFDVLEHLPNPEKALASMFESSTSILVCTTPNKKVEKPIRKLLRDYDETHISVKSPMQWRELVAGNLACSVFSVEAYYDFAVRLGGKLFFKSFRIPTYGLTVRVAVKK
jgi:SAM-dependent methyltransferase